LTDFLAAEEMITSNNAGQLSSLISLSRLMPEPLAISFRAFSSSFFSFSLISSSGRSVARSLRSSSLRESSLLSTCFSSFLLTVTLNHWHLGFHKERMKLNKILICGAWWC